MAVKIIQDELITKINDQLKETIDKAVAVAISNIDWSIELDINNAIQDELQNVDIMEHIDTSELDNKVSSAIDDHDFSDKISDCMEDFLPQLSISKGY